MECDESSNASRDLIQLAQGSDKRVTRLTACTINGHRFHTKDRETRKKSQNSGVVVQADHEGKMIDFYGVLDDIIELSYIGSNKVLIFKCEWWDVGNKKRINVDEFDFVSVNITKTWYKDQPFVLATQVQQVFYVNDIKLGKDWRVAQRMQPRNIYHVHLPSDVLQNEDEPFQDKECSTIHNMFEETDHIELLHREATEHILVDVEVANNEPNSPSLIEDDNNVDDEV